MSQCAEVPMNKVQVGAAPSPNLKTVRSKIGSLDNASYKPGGGNVKIENRKIEIKATPRIAAKNETYVPGGGDKKVDSKKYIKKKYLDAFEKIQSNHLSVNLAI